MVDIVEQVKHQPALKMFVAETLLYIVKDAAKYIMII
jgi:hypothetical protein